MAETKRPTIPAAEEILGGYFPVLDHGFVSLKIQPDPRVDPLPATSRPYDADRDGGVQVPLFDADICGPAVDTT